MNILMINKYPSLEGGADREMFNLANLLKKDGHRIRIFASDIKTKLDPNYDYSFFETFDWKEKDNFNKLIKKFNAFLSIIYNLNSKKRLDELLKTYKPDIAHLHNIHFDVSISVIDLLKKYDIPLVMHLHDARLFCPNGFLFTNGKYCSKCFYHKYYNAFLNKCIKNDYMGSFAVAISFYFAYLKKTFDKIDKFIIPTQIVKSFAVESGIPDSKIELIDYPALVNEWFPSYNYKDYFVFYGQHLISKGLIELIEAMKKLPRDIKLIVTGKGFITDQAKNLAANYDNIEFKGFVSDSVLYEIVSNALFVIIPSIGFENSNCVIREANSLAKAVLGSRIGGIPELIVENKTGLLFEPGNIEEMAEKILFLFKNRDKTIEMGISARKHVEKNNNPNDYLSNILLLYKELIKRYKK